MTATSDYFNNYYSDGYKSAAFTEFLDKIENGTIEFEEPANYDPVWIHIAISNNKFKALNIILDSFNVPKDLDTNERVCYYTLLNKNN